MKLTLRVDPEWAAKAANLATSYARHHGHEGRTRQNQCVIYDVNGTVFAAWGDVENVRVNQAAVAASQLRRAASCA